MSLSKWWRGTKAFPLSLTNGLPSPPPPQQRSPSPSYTLDQHLSRIHTEIVAQMSEENNDFLQTHSEAFIILARANWTIPEAWIYLNRLAAAGGGLRYLPHEIVALARLADRAMDSRVPEGEQVIDAPEGYEDFVLKWRRLGWDADYVQSVAYLLEEEFDPDDLDAGFERFLDLDGVMREFVPGIGEVWEGVIRERRGPPVYSDDEEGGISLEEGGMSFSEEDEGSVTEGETGDESMGDYDDDEYGEAETGDDDDETGESQTGDDEDQTMPDAPLPPLPQSDEDETDDNDIIEPSPTSGRFEVVETPARGRRFVPVTDAERDTMLQEGEYTESFNQNGTSYMYPSTRQQAPTSPDRLSSLPDYESSPPRIPSSPAAPSSSLGSLRERFPEMFDTTPPPPPRFSMDDSSEYSDDDGEERAREDLDRYYEDAIANLEDRRAVLEDSPDEGYMPPVTPTAPVRAGRPSPPPPGGGGGGQEEFGDSDDGLFIRLRGAAKSPSSSSSPSSPGRFSRKSSASPPVFSSPPKPRAPPPSPANTAPKRSSSVLSSPAAPRAAKRLHARRGRFEESSSEEDEEEEDGDEEGLAERIVEDEPSDDEETGADSDGEEEDDEDDEDEDEEDDEDDDEEDEDDDDKDNDIHDRLVNQYQSENDAFVLTHKSVFSILAADGWTPYMAWRFVRFLIWSQGGNSTIADLINMVSEINEDQLHGEYTINEENILVRDFANDSEMEEIMRSLYQAGFDPQYLQGYLNELESDGRSLQEIENELEGYEASDWLWEWVPSMRQIWSDAGETNDAQESFAYLPSQSSPRRPAARFSPQRSEFISGAEAAAAARRGSRSSSGNQMYSPSYPPVPASFEYSSSAAGSTGGTRSSPSINRRASSSSSAKPTPSELFFRGQNPNHAGAASPRSPRFPTAPPQTPPFRRSSIASQTSPVRPTSRDSTTSSQLANRRRLSQSSAGSRASGVGPNSNHSSGTSGGSAHAPLPSPPRPSPPPPRAPQNTPTSSKRAASSRASSAASSGRRPATSDGLTDTFRRLPVVPPPRSLPESPTTSQVGRTRHAFRAPSSQRPAPDFSSPANNPLPPSRSSTRPSSRGSSAISYLNLNQTPSPSRSWARSQSTSPLEARFGNGGRSRGGILRRPDRVNLVDPLRYINRLTPPRRLINTPTKSHRPPSPRRKGPKVNVCGECGQVVTVFAARTVVGGRVSKSASPAVAARRTPTPPARSAASTPPIRKSTSPSPAAAIKKTPTPPPRSSTPPTPPTRKTSTPSPTPSPTFSAGTRGTAPSSPPPRFDIAAIKKIVIVKKAPVAKTGGAVAKLAVVKDGRVRKSGRPTRKPDRYGR